MQFSIQRNTLLSWAFIPVRVCAGARDIGTGGAWIYRDLSCAAAQDVGLRCDAFSVCPLSLLGRKWQLYLCGTNCNSSHESEGYHSLVICDWTVTIAR